jgi:hypothetical protein
MRPPGVTHIGRTRHPISPPARRGSKEELWLTARAATSTGAPTEKDDEIVRSLLGQLRRPRHHRSFRPKRGTRLSLFAASYPVHRLRAFTDGPPTLRAELRVLRGDHVYRPALPRGSHETQSTPACRRPPTDAAQRHEPQDRRPSGAASRRPSGVRTAPMTHGKGKCTVERTRVGADLLRKDRLDRNARTRAPERYDVTIRVATSTFGRWRDEPKTPGLCESRGAVASPRPFAGR